jgi:hypothetical protein
MTLLKTSVTALLAASFLAGAGAAASACEWYQKQVLAKAATNPPAEEQTATTAATPIDPMLLAKTETLETEKTVEE